MVDPVTTEPDPDVVARLAPLLRLASVPGVGKARAARWLVEERGVVGALARARREMDEAPALDRKTAESRARTLLDACARHHTRPIFPEDDEYPESFRHLSDPPSVIYMRGSGIGVDEPAVAVVGSRRATAYGRRVARELGRALADAGVTVISGLALGVDGEAHRGALDRHGRTIALLGAGTDRAQPPGQRRLFEEVLATGGVWSEHPPGTRVEKYHFPERNRLIAALGSAVIVVEAAERSGALITARLGLEAGVDVWAVPGRIDYETSRGTNALLRDGARPVCSLREVVEAYGRPRPVGPRRPTGVSPTAEVLWRVLEGESDFDGIVEAWPGEAPEAGLLLAALAELELGGWVVRTPGASWVRRAA